MWYIFFFQGWTVNYKIITTAEQVRRVVGDDDNMLKTFGFCKLVLVINRLAT